MVSECHLWTVRLPTGPASVRPACRSPRLTATTLSCQEGSGPAGGTGASWLGGRWGRLSQPRWQRERLHGADHHLVERGLHVRNWAASVQRAADLKLRLNDEVTVPHPVTDVGEAVLRGLVWPFPVQDQPFVPWPVGL